MHWIAESFQRSWFYAGALVIGAIYGYGGIIHISNILGFGEVNWADSPFAWKFGDIWWGTLDIAAVIGIVMKSPFGIVALALAAASQFVAYSLIPEMFAVTVDHRATLQGLVYFNAGVLTLLVIAIFLATRNPGA